eukprot:Selendium_serpulae@DN6384_c6_g1_i1.p1
MTAGYAVLTDKTSGEILSSFTWGATPITSVDLTINSGGTDVAVTVYPLVVKGELGDEKALAVTGVDMENKSTGIWTNSTASTLGSANDGQSFVAAVIPTEPATTPLPEGEQTTEAVGGGDGTLPIDGGATTEAVGGDAETTTVAAATGSGYTSKIGALTVMGSMALVLSS